MDSWIVWIDHSILEKEIKMPGHRCIVFGRSRDKEPQLFFHCFPSQRKSPEWRATWLKEFELSEQAISTNTTATNAVETLCVYQKAQKDQLQVYPMVLTLFLLLSLTFHRWTNFNDFFLENARVDSHDSTIHVLEIVSDFTLESFKKLIAYSFVFSAKFTQHDHCSPHYAHTFRMVA